MSRPEDDWPRHQCEERLRAAERELEAKDREIERLRREMAYAAECFAVNLLHLSSFGKPKRTTFVRLLQRMSDVAEGREPEPESAPAVGDLDHVADLIDGVLDPSLVNFERIPKRLLEDPDD